MRIKWILYWKDVRLGIGPFALIAAFDSKESAWKWLYQSNSFNAAQRENIGITTVPDRSNETK